MNTNITYNVSPSLDPRVDCTT